MKLLVTLVGLTLSMVAWSDAPMSTRKQAAKAAANSLLQACSATVDVKQCLVDRGAECTPISADTDDEYRCATQIIIDFTKVPVGSRPPQTSDTFDVTYKIYRTKKGWKGRTRSVTLADS